MNTLPIYFHIFFLFVAVVGLFTFFIAMIRERRRWRESEKKLLELENKRRALFGLPPKDKYFD